MTKFMKNFSYTIVANLVSLIISTMVVIVVPKLVGVEQYGYWQLYLFYSSYVGFLHLGWSDGIYLRYGGEEYERLNKNTFTSQFYLMILFQCIVAFLIVLYAIIFIKDIDKIFILTMVSLNAVIVNVLSVLLLTLQATNRISSYAIISILSRIFYVMLIILLLLIGIREYRLMIVADLTGKFLSLIYAMYICQDIVINRSVQFVKGIAESVDNIKVGSKLMFANIASILIIGVVRFGIERAWDVTTFGKISLTLSVSNLLMIFINATGIVIFPILRNMNKKKLIVLYSTIRNVLMLILFSILLLYFPINIILSKWLPNYEDSLIYMALLFPISLFEGKMGLLINTYLKNFREEKYIMNINLIALVVSIIATLITTVMFKNLNWAILSILITIALRSTLAEFYLAKQLNISIFKEIIYELILTLLFVICGWYFNSIIGFLIYLFLIIIYIYIKKNDIFKSTNKLVKLIKS